MGPVTGRLSRAIASLLVLSIASCGDRRAGVRPEATDGRRLVVFNAGSLARPLRAALDSFAALDTVTIEQESAGSVETARKVTELGKQPDIIAVADYEVIPNFLVPGHTTWYAKFARNRMVVAYSDRSQGAKEITPENWWQVLSRPGVQVGRSDPDLDPNGYRTLLVWQLAEAHYRVPKLYQRLLLRAPSTNVRPKEADLVALLQAGELDYIWSYESIAEAAGLRYVRLPHEIDLSTPADSTLYARASVRIAGKTPEDSITIRGQPIVYGLTILSAAPHKALAERFLGYLASPAGRRVLRAAKLDALDQYLVVGTGAPPALTTSSPHAP